MNIYVEAAKTALKDNPKKLQTILDSTTREILSITEDDFVNADLGVFVTNTRDIKAQKQFLDQAAQAYMQNGGDFGFVFNVMFSESMSEKRRLIESNEEERRDEAGKQQQQELAMAQEQTKQNQANIDKELDLKKYTADLDATVKVKLKEMDMAMSDADREQEGTHTIESLKADILKMQSQMQIEGRKGDIAEKKIESDERLAEQKVIAPTS